MRFLGGKSVRFSKRRGGGASGALKNPTRPGLGVNFRRTEIEDQCNVHINFQILAIKLLLIEFHYISLMELAFRIFFGCFLQAEFVPVKEMNS
jgi:hypothetical protein